MSDLSGRIALVTGASRGIGKAIAATLASRGAVVVAAARGDNAKGTAEEIVAGGGRAEHLALDVTETGGPEGAISAVTGRHGRIDILVNNAGTNLRKPLHEYSLEEWHRVMDTNLTSAFLCSRAVYPAMKQAGGGKIINIGSMMSIFGASFAPAYGASKGGIVQLTKSAASAWARDNIQVNAVLPGWIDTELTQGARRQVPGLHDNVLRRTPAGRWGTIDDMAGVAVFLASAASDFVTGTAIPVYGGYSIQG
jgi:2-deoxy-D-gluconate 3-dehydrogenase